MWLVTQGAAAIHITPIEDLRPHEHSAQCWCAPVEDGQEDGVWLHHSLDGREAYETGERLPS